MKIVSSIKEWRSLRANLNGEIGFIPTMGNLHAGHISLCEAAVKENDVSVVSIFVNPAQFNQADDYVHYPRTLSEDIKLLQQKEIDFLLTPSVLEMYPDENDVKVFEQPLSDELEGAYRPGHFTGVLTVLAKFLNCIQPTRLYLGEKDYQQVLIIKKMITAVLYPTEVVVGKTIRDKSGLALSSRNNRLNPSARTQASFLYETLKSGAPIQDMIARLTAKGFQVDYIEKKWGRILAAVWLDDVRLIDNVSI